jgi:hypothetical protein
MVSYGHQVRDFIKDQIQALLDELAKGEGMEAEA